LHSQVQHQTALGLGVADEAIVMLGDYQEAAAAVSAGKVRAYASVESAHREHLARHPGMPLALAPVPPSEKPAEPGAFASRSRETADRMDEVLREFLGTPEHEALLVSFGLSIEEIGAGTS
jgi:polar amino acid transport system substrate-binding protein